LIVAQVNGVRGIFSAAFDTDVLPRVALFRRQRFWPLYALGLRRVDRIFVQHQGQFADLSPALRQKATIFPGIVEIPPKVIPRQDRGNYIVWVALLRPHKRPDLLVELAREAPDLQFVVCGGTTTFGTPREYSVRIVKDLKSVPNIRYLGEVDHDKTLETIAQATALLSTSDKEGFPNTFLEAWASGTPVVSLSIDPDSLIRDNQLGFLSGTVKNAASDLRSLVNSPKLFDDISVAARSYVETHHSEKTVAKLFNDAIRQAGFSTSVSDERERK
jgi:glycosyltransferase involved in cell wall biosynthesis